MALYYFTGINAKFVCLLLVGATGHGTFVSGT